MTELPTLLKTLLVVRHAQKFDTFRALYERTAKEMDAPGLAGTAPSKAQYYRWLSGQLKGGVPYPDACRVLEQMFPGRTAAELFSPALAPSPTGDSTWASPTAGESSYAGIVAAFASRAEFWACMPPSAMIEHAGDVRMVGLSLNLICQQFPDDRLCALLEAGTRMRCLFLAPDGEAIAVREREEGYRPGGLSALTGLNIRILTERVLPRLSAEARPRLEIAVYDETPRFNILLLDDRLAVVQPYLPVARGIDSPTLVLAGTAGTSLLSIFTDVFASLWERGKRL